MIIRSVPGKGSTTDVPSIVVFIPANVRISFRLKIVGARRAASATLCSIESVLREGGRAAPRSMAGQPPAITIWPDPNYFNVIERSACCTK